MSRGLPDAVLTKTDNDIFVRVGPPAAYLNPASPRKYPGSGFGFINVRKELLRRRGIQINQNYYPRSSLTMLSIRTVITNAVFSFFFLKGFENLKIHTKTISTSISDLIKISVNTRKKKTKKHVELRKQMTRKK